MFRRLRFQVREQAYEISRVARFRALFWEAVRQPSVRVNLRSRKASPARKGTYFGRAKTRLRKAYVAAASFGKHAFQARARRSLRRRPRRFWSVALWLGFPMRRV